jgi:uncharacterized GH25 family protein
MKHNIIFGRKAVIALSLPLLLAFTSASAHQVWLEPSAGGKGAKLFFGEFGGNLRETSPGLLDKFVKPTAHHVTAGKAEPLTVAKSGSAFDIAGRIGVGQSLVAEEANYPISERKNGDKTVRSLYHPAARLVVDWAAQAPRLKLDLVPTGRSDKSGHELKASFNGQPLPKAKVALVTASGWMQELQTADDGTVRVQLPWRGTYVLELSHSDTSPGEREGQAFDRATYVTSLTVVQRKGLQALPAVPPAPPNKLN